MNGFYIDVEKANALGIIGHVRVKLNGIKIGKVIAAKSGKNGFVLFYAYPFEFVNDNPKTKKFRGNVKISINLKN